jgi:transposase InsO family protein
MRQKENDHLIEKIRELHRASRRTYGSHRILKDLKENNIVCGKNRIARLMRLAGICAKTKRRFRVTTHCDHKLPVAENLVNRRFTTNRPNKIWLSDITYIRTQEGWLYLSAVLDLYSRRIIGCSMGERLTKSLVLQAFQQALKWRQPSPHVVFHSDRGSQYAAEDFRSILKQHKFLQSMS